MLFFHLKTTLKSNKVTRLYMSVYLSDPGSRSRQMGIVS